MDDQVTRVCTLISDRAPCTLCPLCIARALHMAEEDVRESLQIIVARPDSRLRFVLRPRLCYGCGVMGDYVGLRY